MSLEVRFFASLREQVGLSETTLDAASIKTVQDVWQLATNDQVMPDNTLCAINMDYVRLDASVKDGDEIAFFPPVTGGSV
jgi:molybdopterin synthase sulfur carrier subunit